MTRCEQLQEAYEDAAFALLMGHVAEAEGKKAVEENETLQQDPDAAVPEEVRKACMKEIGRSFRKSSARSMGRFTMKVVNKVAIVALVGGILFSTAFAASEEFRVNTLNMVVNTFNESVDFDFFSEPVSEETDLEDLRPGFLPGGYTLTEEDDFAGAYWAFYETEQGDRLDIMLSPSGHFDTEGAEIEQVQIRGLPAYVIDQIDLEGDKHGIIKVIVINEKEEYILSVMSLPHSNVMPAPISRKTILQITESLFE